MRQHSSLLNRVPNDRLVSADVLAVASRSLTSIDGPKCYIFFVLEVFIAVHALGYGTYSTHAVAASVFWTTSLIFFNVTVLLK